MSDLDAFQYDANGFLDMERFPDDGSDLGAAELDALRATLHADPVDEPTDDQWDAMFDDVVAGEDAGPFALDDVEGLTADPADDGDLSTPDAGLDDPSDTDADTADDAPTADATADDVDLDATDATDDLVFHPGDDTTVDDLDLDYGSDDGGLDLGAPDDGIDDAYSPEALDDAPVDIANNDFEDLL